MLLSQSPPFARVASFPKLPTRKQTESATAWVKWWEPANTKHLHAIYTSPTLDRRWINVMQMFCVAGILVCDDILKVTDTDIGYVIGRDVE